MGNLINPEGIVFKSGNSAQDDAPEQPTSQTVASPQAEPERETRSSQNTLANTLSRSPEPAVESTEFQIRISGPGLDSVVVIRSADDIEIVDTILRKVKRSFPKEDASLE